jgi:hypothetical protein
MVGPTLVCASAKNELGHAYINVNSLQMTQSSPGC